MIELIFRILGEFEWKLAGKRSSPIQRGQAQLWAARDCDRRRWSSSPRAGNPAERLSCGRPEPQCQRPEHDSRDPAEPCRELLNDSGTEHVGNIEDVADVDVVEADRGGVLARELVNRERDHLVEVNAPSSSSRSTTSVVGWRRGGTSRPDSRWRRTAAFALAIAALSRRTWRLPAAQPRR